MVLLSKQPAEAEDRAVPGHWECDLIVDKKSSSSVSTLVKHQTLFIMLCRGPVGRLAEQAKETVSKKIGSRWHTVSLDYTKCSLNDSIRPASNFSVQRATRRRLRSGGGHQQGLLSTRQLAPRSCTRLLAQRPPQDSHPRSAVASDTPWRFPPQPRALWLARFAPSPRPTRSAPVSPAAPAAACR